MGYGSQNANHEALYHLLNSNQLDLVLNDQQRAFSDKYVNFNPFEASFFLVIHEKHPMSSYPFFEPQLKDCGVEYFDYYLMHAQGADNFRFFKSCKAYETAFALKEEGKIKHVGISFHDKADVLEQIYHDWNADYYYNNVHTAQGRKASDCIKCGKCEKACPQHLEIRRLLEDVAMVDGEDFKMKKDVILWAGAGQIGMAIARRIGTGKRLL